MVTAPVSLSFIRSSLENILVVFGIFILQVVGKAISGNLIVVEGLVSWFLPAGIKCCFFLFLPYRLWPTAIATFLVVITLQSPDDFSWNMRNWFFQYIYPKKAMLIYLAAAYIYRQKFKSFQLNNVAALQYWFGSFFIACVVNGSFIAVEAHKFSNVSIYDSFTFITALAVGDFMGLVVVLPLFLLFKSMLGYKAWIDDFELIRSALLIITLVPFIDFVIIIFNPELLYFAQLAALVLLVWITYRKGYVVGSVMLFSINTTIVINTYFSVIADTQTPSQVFIFALTLVGLFVGAALDEQKQAHRKLLKTTEQLVESNKILMQANEENRKLSAANIGIREEEKQRISRELHDEFGQQLTALKTNIHVIYANFKSPIPDKNLSKINRISDNLYHSLKNMTTVLRPSLLDEFGLAVALENGDLKEAVENASITYNCDINIDDTLLTEEQSLTMYRVAQEAINNAIKHANAQSISLSLYKSEEAIELNIHDDGIGFDPDNVCPGHGLTIMHERVESLNGNFEISGLKSGVEIKATFPLT